MKPSREYYKKQKIQQQKGCSTLCCSSCRLSVSSSEEESVSSSNRFPLISSLAHAMVQERLDQMIREARQEARHKERIKRQFHTLNRRMNQNACVEWSHRSRKHDHGTKFVVMLAMEKCSYDPREDFRESMVEMITMNQIQEAKELRSLLNYYLSMNSEEYHWIILEAFHEVCSDLFLSCKWT